MSDNYPGVYAAIVADNADPYKSYRLRLKVPQILGDVVTPWAPPSGSTNVTLTVGQSVYVQFVGGDLSLPIYISPGVQYDPPPPYVPTTPTYNTGFYYNSSWSNLGAGYEAAGWSLDSEKKMVRLRGMVKGTDATIPNVICTLDPSILPVNRHIFICPAQGSSATVSGHCRVDVPADGRLTVVNYGSGCGPGFISLDGISYSTV